MVTASVVLVESNQTRRKSFSIKDKREFILAVDTLVSTGASRHEACNRLGLPHMYYERIKKVIEKVESLENGTGYIPYKTNNSARKIHPVPQSLLCVIKDDFACFVVQTRHRGI